MALNQVQINYFFLKYQNNITIFITIQYSDIVTILSTAKKEADS